MKMNSLIEKRKQKWLDFYDLNSPINRLLLVSYSIDLKKTYNMKIREEKIESMYHRYMCSIENMEKLNDNTVPHIPISGGTGIFAQAFGCEIQRTASHAAFTMPLISDVSEWYKIKMPKLENVAHLMEFFDTADKLRAKVGDDLLFGLPDMQTPMDVVALIWDKNDLYAAMYDEENAIKELACMVKELMFEFLDEWFRRYGRDFIAHYPRYYMPYGITMSEDEVGIVSSDMFKEFYEEELHEFSNRYGAIGIHCCADSKHQWENFKNIPNLKLLNINLKENDTKDAVKCFANTTAQLHNTVVDIKDIENHEKIHLGNLLYAGDLDDAIQKAEQYYSFMAD